MKIQLKNFSKKYEGTSKYTLKNINLEFDDEDFVVILGPSGCGKTTLLRMIAGLNSITSGELVFNNRRVNELEPSEREIAMVFQNYALYPHMSVFSNLAFGLKMRKAKKSYIAQRVQEVAEMLNISEHLYKKPKALSGGQQQRVAIGRAVVRNPKVFLMDEPLSNLDAKLREYMRKEIIRIHRKVGATSIYVTHDQLEAMSMATKIVLMNDGFVQQVGTPFELYKRPANLFTARFIGSPEMNIWKGKIEGNVFSEENGLFTINVSKSLGKVKKLEDGEYSLGARSENIEKVTTANKNNQGVFTSVIEIVELQGKDTLVATKAGESKINLTVSSVDEKEWKINQKIKLIIDEENLHIFDKDGNRAN